MLLFNFLHLSSLKQSHTKYKKKEKIDKKLQLFEKCAEEMNKIHFTNKLILTPPLFFPALYESFSAFRDFI